MTFCLYQHIQFYVYGSDSATARPIATKIGIVLPYHYSTLFYTAALRPTM